MDIVLHYDTAAPSHQTWSTVKPTLIVSWWCTCFSITVILFRISGRYVRTEKVFLEDGIMISSIIPLLIRMAIVHIVLLYGTNNSSTIGLSSEDIRRRAIGSQLVLVSRIMYAAYLWAIKYSISVYLRSLTGQIWQRFHHTLLRYLHILLGITFIAIIISDLVQCRPFSHYWQVVPDPGPQCRQGYAPFFTTGIMNIITNLALIGFPIPLILKSQLSRTQKLSVVLRLALPFLGVLLTVYQMPKVVARNGDQQIRTLIASFDILLCTFTSNSSVLGSLLQDKGYKKTKYKHKHHSTSPSYTNPRPTTRNGRKDSDEDFMISDGKSTMFALDDLGHHNVNGDVEERGEGRVEVRRPDEVWAPVGKDQIRIERAWEISVTESGTSGESMDGKD